MALTSPLTRICVDCRHRLITVTTDMGKQLELDTNVSCHVITGREIDGIPIFVPSRAYPVHSEICKPSRVRETEERNLLREAVQRTRTKKAENLFTSRRETA